MGCVASTHSDSSAFFKDGNTVYNHDYTLNQNAIINKNDESKSTIDKKCTDMEISDLSYAEHIGKYRNMDVWINGSYWIIRCISKDDTANRINLHKGYYKISDDPPRVYHYISLGYNTDVIPNKTYTLGYNYRSYDTDAYVIFSPLFSKIFKHQTYKTPIQMASRFLRKGIRDPLDLFYYHSQIEDKGYLITKCAGSNIVYKADITMQKWCKLLTLPSWIKFCKINIDNKHHKLYILSPSIFCVFDLNKNKWNLINQYHADLDSESEIVSFYRISPTSRHAKHSGSSSNVNLTKIVYKLYDKQIDQDCIQDPALESILNATIFHIDEFEPNSGILTSKEVAFDIASGSFRDHSEEYLYYDKEEDSIFEDIGWDQQMVYLEGLDRFYFVECGENRRNLEIHYVERSRSDGNKWVKKFVNVDTKMEKTISKRNIFKIVSIRERFIVIFSFYERAICLFDIKRETCIRLKQNLLEEFVFETAVYNPVDGRIYTLGVDTLEHCMLYFDDLPPLSFFVQEIVCGYFRAFEKRLFMTVPASLVDVIVSYCDFEVH